MSIELPPLPGTALIFPNGKPERVMDADMVERAVEARERILLARIAELEADAFGARRALWVVLRSTSRGMWYTPSLSAFMEHGEGAEIQTRHEPRGDISYFAAIDAARKA